ncbi:TonB-dependent receptor [Iodidimonas sp. SYSU 1G8]|uniref:TonB-dependent siderophore receptor n=1 Tax=Iodidimonas sp. SYSU 1G8 TaxID=3133967 RepID=UPI0031FE58FA
MLKSALVATTMVVASAATVRAAEQGENQGWTAESVTVTADRETYAEPQATTATRTATPVEKVPQSIQTLTRTLIEEQDLQTLSAALVNVSGVTPTSTDQTLLQPALIRGFGVGYYIDGMPTYQLPASVADPGTLINVERIEVAKGPTATLYGGGSGAPLSGIINLVSRDPYDRFGASFAARGGSFSTFGGDGDVNVPIAEGIAFRINGMIESADTHVDFVSRDRYALFPTLSVDLGAETRLVIRGRYNRLEQTEYAGLPFELLKPNRLIDRKVYGGARDMPRTTVENKSINAKLTHNFSDRISAEVAINHAISAFDEWGTFPYGQLGGTVYNFGSAYLPSKSKETFVTGSVTARFGDGGFRQQILAGVDYDITHYYGAMYFDTAWGVVDYAAPLPAQSYVVPPFYFDQTDRLESVAGFLQDQISIGDRLDVTLGVRWTQIKINSAISGLPTVTSDEKVTPRAGATFRIADGLSLFAGYSEGFRGVVAGGFYGVTPKPETSQNWEAGFKFTAPIKGLTGTASLYQITRQNVITPDPANPFFYLQTGEQRARGAELDLIYEPNPAFSMLFNYAYTDAEVTKDNALPVGDRLRAVPTHSGRLAVRYRFLDGDLKGLAVGAGITAVSSRELTLPNTVSVKGNALVDLQVSYDLGRVSLGVSVVNLLGSKAYEPYQYFGGAYVIPTQSRSAFVTLRGDF